jgi:hypothetical protein
MINSQNVLCFLGILLCVVYQIVDAYDERNSLKFNIVKVSILILLTSVLSIL